MEYINLNHNRNVRSCCVLYSVRSKGMLRPLHVTNFIFPITHAIDWKSFRVFKIMLMRWSFELFCLVVWAVWVDFSKRSFWLRTTRTESQLTQIAATLTPQVRSFAQCLTISTFLLAIFCDLFLCSFFFFWRLWHDIFLPVKNWVQRYNLTFKRSGCCNDKQKIQLRDWNLLPLSKRVFDEGRSVQRKPRHQNLPILRAAVEKLHIDATLGHQRCKQQKSHGDSFVCNATHVPWMQYHVRVAGSTLQASWPGSFTIISQACGARINVEYVTQSLIDCFVGKIFMASDVAVYVKLFTFRCTFCSDLSIPRHSIVTIKVSQKGTLFGAVNYVNFISRINVSVKAFCCYWLKAEGFKSHGLASTWCRSHWTEVSRVEHFLESLNIIHNDEGYLVLDF